MRKYINKILAGVIALALVFGSFTGIGMSVVEAADIEAEKDDDDNYITLPIQIVDEDLKPVQGVELQLYRKPTYSGENSLNYFERATDANGITIYRCNNNEMFNEINNNISYEVQIKNGNSYEFVDHESIKIYFGEGVGDDPFTSYTCINYVNDTKELYDGKMLTVKVKKTSGGSTTEPVVQEQFLEGKAVKEDGSVLSESIMLRLSSVDLSGTPVDVEFKTNEKGEFKYKINDIKDGDYRIQPASGSGYKYSGAQAMVVTIKTTNGQKDVTVKGTGNTTIQVTVVEDSSPAIAKVTAITKSVDKKGGKVTLNVTGRYLSDSLYYKKYYVKGDRKGDLSLASEKVQKISAKGDTDREKTIEVSLPNTLEYFGAGDSPKVTAWKIYVGTEETLKTKGISEEIKITDASSQQGGDSDKKDIKVSKLTITGASKKLAVGKKVKLTAKVSPTNATNQSVKWTSSNKKYATVDSKGNVTLKKAGAGKNVTITATAADGSKVKATYKIKIMKSSVKSISLKAKKSVKAGKSLKVKAAVKTTGKSANKTLKWTSSNTKYATVSAKGVVKAKKAGKGKKVKITATATDGSKKKKTVTIKIK